MAEKEVENKLEPIQSVERALQVLELLSTRGSLGLNDMHKALGVNKASLLRLAYTLVGQGFAAKDEQTGEYSLTLKSYEIGLRAVKNLDKMSLITSTLADLSSQTGRIAQFSVEDNNTLLCLQSIGQKNNPFSVYTNLGGRSPLYCTSAGKALLSACSNTEIIARWDNLDPKPLTKNTITDIQELLSDISRTRQRGYALDQEENEYGICCIGSIVMGQTGKPVGAISLSGNAFSGEDEIRSLADILLPVARRLSGMMGYYIAP
ncbi:MAG TPA: IclR family transcriptional regulator [Lachnospiraceae bacterium]|nr:IclR family transcriptional regulator [Lachnospiraceae bacterium]